MQAAVQAGIASPGTLVGFKCQREKHSAENSQVPSMTALNGKKREFFGQSFERSMQGEQLKPEDFESNIQRRDSIMRTSSCSGGSKDGHSDSPNAVTTVVKSPSIISSIIPGNNDRCEIPNSDVSDKDNKSSFSSHSQNPASNCCNVTTRIGSSALLDSQVSDMETSSPDDSHGNQKEAARGKPFLCSGTNALVGDKNTAALSDKGSCEAGNVNHLGSQRSIARFPSHGEGHLLMPSNRRVTDAASCREDRFPPSAASDIFEGKIGSGSNPSTATGSELNSLLKACNEDVALTADQDAGLHPILNQTKDAIEDKKQGERLLQVTHLIQYDDGKCSAGSTTPVLNSFAGTISPQIVSAEKFHEAYEGRKCEDTLQSTRAAEVTSLLPETSELGVIEGSRHLLTQVTSGETVTFQGVNCVAANEIVQVEKGLLEAQGGCAVGSNLEANDEHRGCVDGCAKDKTGISLESSESMSNSLSPATSSSSSNGSHGSSRKRLKSSSKDHSNLHSEKVSGKFSGQDVHLLGEKRSTSASSHRRELRSSKQIVDIKEFSPRVTRDEAGAEGTRMDDNNQAEPLNKCTNRESESGSEGSDSTGSEKSLRLTQHLASDLEQYIGTSSESHAGGTDSISGTSEEDALEVARQVAMEVEQEMEQYSKPLGSSSSDLEMKDVNVLDTHESGAGATNTYDVVKERTLSANCNLRDTTDIDHAGHSGTAALDQAHDQLKINKQVEVAVEEGSEPVLDGVAIKSVNRTAVSSGLVAAGNDRVQSTALDTEDPMPDIISNKDGGLEFTASSKPVKPAHLISSASPSLSGSSGSVVDCDGAKSPGFNLSSHDPISPQKAIQPIEVIAVTGRPMFDLNEGFITDEEMQEELIPPLPASLTAFSTNPGSHAFASSSLAAPIAVVASTNGSFIPPASPVQINKDNGWKGSAATSAFRPAEPRRVSELHTSIGETTLSGLNCVSTTRHVREPLDIDLNVADDGQTQDIDASRDGYEEPATVVSEQARSLLLRDQSNKKSTDTVSGSLPLQPSIRTNHWPDLDLNRVDEIDDGKALLASELRAPESLPSLTPHDRYSGNVVRDFDLNDGPVASFEEEIALDETSQQHSTAGVSTTHMFCGLRLPPEMVQVTPWLPPCNSVNSPVRMPTFPGGRAESSHSMTCSQPFLGNGMSLTPFPADLFGAGSPAISFPAAPPGPYPYAAFPFGGNLAFGSTIYGEQSSSASFPSLSSQVMTSGGIPHAFLQPGYFTGLPESSGTELRRAWSSRLNFDLNAGPENVDCEVVRADSLNFRHPWMLGNQQMGDFRQLGASSGTPKRKGTEGGWEANKSGYKHPTWR